MVGIEPHLEPRMVKDVVQQSRSWGDAAILVVAPFLSEETQRKLEELGANYADTTGNIRIAMERPAVYLKTEGEKKNPWTDERPLQSLKGQGAGRVVRALCDFRPPYGIRELAARAALPLGTMARVVDVLDRAALLERTPKGRILDVNWAGILRSWANDYNFLKYNPHALYFEPRGLSVLSDKLRDAEQAYCVTGSLAAVQHAPIAPPRLAIIYAENAPLLAERLGLHQVESNGNVILVEPKSRLPFERTWEAQGIHYAALSQVVSDLMNSPGRGPNEAEALLEWMSDHTDEWRA